MYVLVLEAEGFEFLIDPGLLWKPPRVTVRSGYVAAEVWLDETDRTLKTEGAVEREIKELAAADLTEMTAFCFRKLAGLEARFIALCHRAEALGIDCSDLKTVEVAEAEPAAALKVLN